MSEPDWGSSWEPGEDSFEKKMSTAKFEEEVDKYAEQRDSEWDYRDLTKRDIKTLLLKNQTRMTSTMNKLSKMTFAQYEKSGKELLSEAKRLCLEGAYLWRIVEAK